MPLFDWMKWFCVHLPHEHLGSVFSLDLILFLILIFSKPSDASEMWQWISSGAHLVDPTAECIDADASLESESGEQQQQQQQQPTTTTIRWSLSPFLEAESGDVLQ